MKQIKNFTALIGLSAVLCAVVSCGTRSDPNTGVGVVKTNSIKDSPTPYPVADADRAKAVDELIVLRRQILALEGNLIAPAKEDLDQYADLLQDSRSGLARLFPRNSSNERRPLLVRGGGSYYQFKNRTNEYGYGNGVEYGTTNSPQFSVGFAGVDFGFFAQLGTTDIRRIDETNPAVAFAVAYPSPNGQPEVTWRNEQSRWRIGMSNAGVTFKDRTEAIVGMSYVVRSVNESGYDTVTVFQVVRRDPTDESLIIAWKLLRDLDKPRLKRN